MWTLANDDGVFLCVQWMFVAWSAGRIGWVSIRPRRKKILMESITEDGVAGKYENELRKRI